MVGAGFDGETWDVALTGDGGVVVGGFFDEFDGVFRRNIAKLGADGSLDGSFVVGSGFDDGVLALAAQDDGKVIAGGAFRSYGGVSAGGLVRLNSDGSRDPSFDVGTGFNGDVWDVAVLDDGDVVVAGSFTTFDGVSAIRMVRLNADGSRDTAFDVGAGFNGEVRTVAVDSKGRLVAGGLFTTFGGGSANRVVRLEPDGSRSPSFALGQGFDGPVYSVAVQADDSVVAGGQFTAVDTVASPGLARLGPGGTPDPSFSVGSGFNSPVQVVVAQPNGKLLVGGAFTLVDDVPSNRLVRLGVTRNWTAFSPARTVSPVVVSGLTNGVTYTIRLRALNAGGSGGASNSGTGIPVSVPAAPPAPDVTAATSSCDVRWSAGDDGGSAITQFVVQQRIAEGEWTEVFSGDALAYTATGLDVDAAHTYRVAAINAVGEGAYSESSSECILAVPLPLSAPTIVSVVGGDRQLTVGFTAPDSDGGSPVTNYEYLLDDGSGDGSLDPSFVVGSGFGSSVYSLAVQPDGRVVAVGVFRTFDGVSANRIVRLDADGGRDGSFVVGAGFDGETWDVALTGDGGVVVGGFFDEFDGVFRRNIAKLGADGSLDGSFVVGSGFDDGVLALAAQDDGKVIAGGAFRSYGGVSAGGLVRLNADGSIDPSFDVGTGFNGDVWDVVVLDDGDVVVAGSFTTFDGVSAIRMVRLNADGSRDTAFDVGAGFNGEVRTVAVDSKGRLVAGGGFTSFAGNGSRYLARIEPDGSNDPSFAIGTGPNNWVYAVAVQADDSVVAGGQFTAIDTVASPGLARLGPGGTPDPSFSVGSGFNSPVQVVVAQPNGKLLVGGAFTLVDDVPSNRLVRLGVTRSWTAFSPARTVSPVVVSGLTNGVTYTIRLRALNAGGSGGVSNSATGIPVSVPAAPPAPDVTAATTSCDVRWSAADDGGSAITQFVVQQRIAEGSGPRCSQVMPSPTPPPGWTSMWRTPIGWQQPMPSVRVPIPSRAASASRWRRCRFRLRRLCRWLVVIGS